MPQHWADKKAEEVIERKKSGDPPVLSTGITTSGIIHLGNLNDPVRASFVKKAIKSKDEEVKEFNWIADDGDPVKKIPQKFMNLDFEIMDVEKERRKELQKHLGKPYSRIPDPLGCCESWSKHFQNLLEKDFEKLGLNPKIYSSTEDLYGSGRLDDEIRKALKNRERIKDILEEYRTEPLSDDWTIINAICEKCGKLTHINDWDENYLYYRCTDKVVGEKKLEGCGNEGKVPFSQGKLSWRVDWPARWSALGVTFEPFGKDHAAAGGSYDTGSRISREIFGWEPPIPLVYGWFTLEGKPFSSSEGNLVTRKELTDVMSTEALKYFFTKKPRKERDLKLSRIYKLVDQFDLAEAVYFGEKEARTEKRELIIKRNYELASSSIPDEKPVRVPYKTCATVSQLARDNDEAIEMLVEMEQIPEEISEENREEVLERVKMSGVWLQNYAPDQFRIKVQDSISHQIKEKLTDEQKKVLITLRKELKEKEWTATDLQNRIYEMKDEFELSAKNVFQAIYLTILGDKSGPRAGQLIKAVGQEKVTELLNEL